MSTLLTKRTQIICDLLDVENSLYSIIDISNNAMNTLRKVNPTLYNQVSANVFKAVSLLADAEDIIYKSNIKTKDTYEQH